ncbi:MAG: glycosyltransferase [Bacteroidetes bacterium]|nr:MAG: glycosyltransferase [Bacteroidota bacterium]
MKGPFIQTPLVSVVMPVFNAERYVEKAVKSILQQTYSNFEFIIVNDGSTDGSLNRLQQFTDNRIQVISFDQNRGIVSALNKGIEVAKGSLIARMDADDESHIERLQYQVDYLMNHPEVGVCGTWFKLHTGKIIQPPQSHELMRYELINRSVFHHASVMMRSDLIAPYKSQLYNPDFEFTEDLELWMRLVKQTTFANLNRVLLTVRANQGTHVKYRHVSSEHNVILKQQHLEYLFPFLLPEEVVFLAKQLNRIEPLKSNRQDFVRFTQLLHQCWTNNKYPALFSALSSAIWFKLASNAPQSFLWLSICKTYPFATTSIWQKGWLLIKPIARRFKV